MKKTVRRLLLKANANRILVNNKPLKINQFLSGFFSVRANNAVEPEITHFIDGFLKEGFYFVDIGANIGLLSIQAAEKIGASGKVLCFEPNPFVYRQLEELVRLNGKGNIHCFPFALGDQQQWLSLHMNDLDSILMTRSSFVIDDTHQKVKATEVLVLPLDNVYPKNSRLDLLKIDVEGAEISVLNGAKETIELYKPVVCLEVHGIYFDDPQEFISTIFSFFETAGYMSLNLLTNKETSTDDFLRDSGLRGIDPMSGKEFKTSGYGHLIFYHKAVNTFLING